MWAAVSGFDALDQLVEGKKLAEVHLLTREIRHAAGRRFQAEHQRSLEVVFCPPQFFIAHRLFLQLAELPGDRLDDLARRFDARSRIDRKAARIAVRVELAEEGVSQSLPLADVLEKPRAHAASEECIEHVARETFRVRQRVRRHSQSATFSESTGCGGRGCLERLFSLCVHVKHPCKTSAKTNYRHKKLQRVCFIFPETEEPESEVQGDNNNARGLRDRPFLKKIQ